MSSNTRDSGYGSAHSGASNPQDNKSSNQVHHSSNLLNKLDPRVDSTQASSGPTSKAPTNSGPTGTGPTGSGITGGTHTSMGGGSGAQHNDPRSTNAGPHSSNMTNTVDPRVDSSRQPGGVSGLQQHDPRSSNTGPHSSNIANTIDPRNNPSKHQGGANTGGFSTSGAGHSASHSNYDHNSSANAGPHGSSLANTVDPRVEENSQHRQNVGHSSGTGAGYGSNPSSNNYDSNKSTNAGPHNSNMANQVDPRIDSDRSRTAGGLGHESGYGQSGSHAPSSHTAPGQFGNNTPYDDHSSKNNQAPHSSGIANKLDPRVDNEKNNHGPSHATPGQSGNTSYNDHSSNTPYNDHSSKNNQEPHSSGMANKLDPRVDNEKDKHGQGQTGYEQPTAISSHAEGHGQSNGHGGFGSSGKHAPAPSNATANASVVGGSGGHSGAGSQLPPEGQASASGPGYASAETSTNPIKKGLDKLTGKST